MSSRSSSSWSRSCRSSPPIISRARANTRADRRNSQGPPAGGSSMLDTDMLIGSKFVTGAEAPQTVLNPKTEAKIVELPDASAAQVDAAVNAAEKAFQSWSRTTPVERSGLLLKLADAVDRD